MAVTHEDIKALRDEFDDRYVLQSDCDDRQSKVNSRFANDDKRLEMVSHDLGAFKKIGWIAISALVAEVALMILNLLIERT